MTNGFHYSPDIFAQGNYVRDIVRDPVWNTMEHSGRQQYSDARFHQHGSSEQQSHNWPNNYLGDQHGNMYVCDQEGNLYEAPLYSAEQKYRCNGNY